MPDTFAYGVSEEQALATLRAAFAGPIPYIDTAALYGDGESERRVGLVLGAGRATHDGDPPDQGRTRPEDQRFQR